MPQKFLSQSNCFQMSSLKRLSAKSWLLSLCVGSLLAAAPNANEVKSVNSSSMRSSHQVQPSIKPINLSSEKNVLDKRATVGSSSVAKNATSGGSALNQTDYKVQGYFDPGLTYTQSEKENYAGFSISPDFGVSIPVYKKNMHQFSAQLQSSRSRARIEKSEESDKKFFFCPDMDACAVYRNKSLIQGMTTGGFFGGNYSYQRGNLLSFKSGLEIGRNEWRGSFFGGFGSTSLTSSSTNLPAGMTGAKIAPYVAASVKKNNLFAPLLKGYLTGGVFIGDKISTSSLAQKDITVANPILLQAGALYQILKWIQIGGFVRTENLANKAASQEDVVKWSDFLSVGLNFRFFADQSTRLNDFKDLKMRSELRKISSLDPFIANIESLATRYLNEEDKDEGASAVTFSKNILKADGVEALTVTFNEKALSRDLAFKEGDKLYLAIDTQVTPTVMDKSKKVLSAENTQGSMISYFCGNLVKSSKSFKSSDSLILDQSDCQVLQISCTAPQDSALKIIGVTKLYLTNNTAAAESYKFSGLISAYPSNEKTPESRDFSNFSVLEEIPADLKTKIPENAIVSTAFKVTDAMASRAFLSIDVESSKGTHPYDNLVEYKAIKNDDGKYLISIVSKADQALTSTQTDYFKNNTYDIYVGDHKVLGKGLKAISSTSGDTAVSLSMQSGDARFAYDSSTNVFSLKDGETVLPIDPVEPFVLKADNDAGDTVKVDFKTITFGETFTPDKPNITFEGALSKSKKAVNVSLIPNRMLVPYNYVKGAGVTIDKAPNDAQLPVPETGEKVTDVINTTTTDPTKALITDENKPAVDISIAKFNISLATETILANNYSKKGNMAKIGGAFKDLDAKETENRNFAVPDASGKFYLYDIAATTTSDLEDTITDPAEMPYTAYVCELKQS